MKQQIAFSRRGFLAASSCALGSAVTTKLFAEQKAGVRSARPEVAAAQAVLYRLLGGRADAFDLNWMAAENGHEVYAVSAAQGRVRIQGSSAVALCRGAYAYLRQACNAMVTWSGQHLDLSARFPDFAESRVVCPYRHVQYYNTCTYGYTMAFWNWERWERELDWMALHGINMALAMEGQEAIWQKVWLGMGLSQMELDRHFTGPAQLPWHRMGNIDNFDGPLPQEAIDQRCALQKRILGRMRELGITPVVPGFSGFVPQGFKRLRPEVKTFTELWERTKPRQTKTFIVDPDAADVYKEIGKKFIEAYRAEYGPTQYYLVDTFNEMTVPARPGHIEEDVARFARSVYEGILAGDPQGVWVMQAWICRNEPKFWDDATLHAFLKVIPDDRMIILDYSSDFLAALEKDAWKNPLEQNVWKQHGAFHGKRWFNGMVHTEGGNNNVKGNLAFIAAQPAAVLRSAEKGNLAGWSISMEGTQNNEVVYELMTDVGWSATEIDPHRWIVDYCRARYGAVPEAMQEAWELLMRSAYGWHDWLTHHSWQARPTLDPAALAVDTSLLFGKGVERFLACSDQLIGNTLYRNDLIELVVQAAGGSVDQRLKEACEAHKVGNSSARDRKAAEAIAMLLRMDALLHVRPDRRLEQWVDDARRCGATPDRKAYYEENARLLITFWGWTNLNDYASKVWSGLTRDYYAVRWQAFFEALRQGTKFDADALEESWISQPYRPSHPHTVTDLAAEARQMLAICAEWS